MGKYNFDQYIDRYNTWSSKYDCAEMFGKPEGLIPLWVADMDFQAPDCVKEALRKCVDFGIFGYSTPQKDYFDAVIGWFTRRHGWTPKPEWCVRTCGVVVSLAMAIQSLTREGDSILIQPPVYYPFADCICDNGRKMIHNTLLYKNGRYSIDFADFEAKIVDNDVKLFILCNPHNPVGRVWTPEELSRMGAVCKKHHVYVVSDEIHCDILLPGHSYTPFLAANPDMEDLAVICTAPSKTFNLAGLQTSNIFIPNEALRTAFKNSLDRCGAGPMNLPGMVACKAAYEGGEEWLDECLAYINGNLQFVREYLRTEIPQIKLVEPEATYFAWLDCSALHFSTGDALNAFITDCAGLWLDDGQLFGEVSRQFQRIVLACRRELLEKAMHQLKDAVCKLNAAA